MKFCPTVFWIFLKPEIPSKMTARLREGSLFWGHLAQSDSRILTLRSRPRHHSLGSLSPRVTWSKLILVDAVCFC